MCVCSCTRAVHTCSLVPFLAAGLSGKCASVFMYACVRAVLKCGFLALSYQWRESACVRACVRLSLLVFPADCIHVCVRYSLLALCGFLELGCQRISWRAWSTLKRRWYCRELERTLINSHPACMKFRQSAAETHGKREAISSGSKRGCVWILFKVLGLQLKSTSDWKHGLIGRLVA